MVREIEISDLAKKRLSEINDYILENWGISVLQKFNHKLESRLELVRFMPEAGRLEIKYLKVRSIIITGPIKMYYKVFMSKIVIVSFFNSRMSRSKRLK